MSDLYFSPAAERDLVSIWEVARLRGSDLDAEYAVKSINKVLESVQVNPNLGSYFAPGGPGCRFIRAGGHLVLYLNLRDAQWNIPRLHTSRAPETGLSVLRILDGRMDPSAYL